MMFHSKINPGGEGTAAIGSAYSTSGTAVRGITGSEGLRFSRAYGQTRDRTAEENLGHEPKGLASRDGAGRDSSYIVKSSAHIFFPVGWTATY